MKKEQAVHESFCSAYAGAVVRFIVTGINEDVTFDAKTERFTSKQVDDHVRAADCDWWVGEDWQSFVGPLPCETDLAHPKFSEEVLAKAIIFALRKSATGKRMSHILAGLD
jgi:hypothetical protein